MSRAPLRRVSSRALRAASRARAASIDFSRMRLATWGFSSRNGASFSLTRVSTYALDLGVAQLGLGLPLELRLGDLHRDDRGQPLAQVLAGDGDLRLLEQVVGVRRSCSWCGSGRALKPIRWVPPSWVLMLLAKEKIFSS